MGGARQARPGDIARDHGRGARRPARPGRRRAPGVGSHDHRSEPRLPDHTERARHGVPVRAPSPLAAQPAPGRHRARAPRSGPGDPRLFLRARLHPGGHPNPHRVDRRGGRQSVRRRILRPRHGIPGADGAAVRRGCRGGARQGVLLRAHLSRGKVEDATTPHRILDGRTRGRLERLQRQYEPPGGIRLLRRGPLPRAPQTGARGAGARHAAARSDPAAVPADFLHRCGRKARDPGQWHRVGPGPRRRRGNVAREAVRPPGAGLQLPEAGESILYEGKRRRPAHRAQQRHARTRGIRGDHRRQPAGRRPRQAAGADSRGEAPRRRLRVVPRPAQVRDLRTLRLRTRRRAHGGVDLRHPAHPGGDRVSADAL